MEFTNMTLKEKVLQTFVVNKRLITLDTEIVEATEGMNTVSVTLPYTDVPEVAGTYILKSMVWNANTLISLTDTVQREMIK